MLLQKKDSEGFGFVLRGAKGETDGKQTPPACISRALTGPAVSRLLLWLFVVFCSSDPHRGVHPHPGLPCPAVPGVCG